ncbi:nucleotidyltransferase family protein [Candidatus Halocynthiibacter alkanivorans]|uniref:nucleotidyltransferase family protein n=1 Tax=Candidatus Halocynthiibacter alkanivorans TaxID=2267619 RepID=UPI000DF1BAB2|nr:nucleotidyltransferase family protein [Candidatus Halocynthiibacter alkanivorans]
MSQALLHIGLLAAGTSRRMLGADKLMQPVGDTPLLRQQARRCIDNDLPVTVALPPGFAARRQALEGLDLRQITVTADPPGMGDSIAALARDLIARDTRAALLLLPADMPEIDLQDIKSIAAEFARQPDQPLRATSVNGQPGHPVVFPARMLSGLAALSGDQGAQRLLKQDPPRLMALPADHAVCDLDTPQDWAAWRARQS